MNYTWEPLADSVARCRLPFLDVTVGVIWGRAGVVLVDTGSTLTESRAIRADVETMTGHEVSHIVLTHHHFDHVLGASAFDTAAVYCAAAAAAVRGPQHEVHSDVIDLGDRVVSVRHPGRGHTDHDLIAVVQGAERTVVFCGDLVEESADPSIDSESDVPAWPATLDRLAQYGENAVYVPGHGAVVDAGFVRAQSQWLATR